jgi:hypothetical protein
MGKTAYIVATTVLMPVSLLLSGHAMAARSTSKTMVEDCEERRSAPIAAPFPSIDIRLPKPTIMKRKRRYIRM